MCFALINDVETTKHNSSRLTEILKMLGMGDTEAVVYLILLKKPGISVSDLSKETKLTRQRVYDILESLSEKGMVYVSTQRPRKFFAVSPEVATSILVRDMEKRLYDLLRLREEFIHIVRSVGYGRSVSNHISYEVTGRRALVGAVKDIINRTKNDLTIAATKNETMRIVYEYKSEILEAVERGVKVYLLTDLSEIPNDILEFLHKIASVQNFELSARIYVRDGEETVLMPSEGSLKERRWYDEGVVLNNRDISAALRRMILAHFNFRGDIDNA